MPMPCYLSIEGQNQGKIEGSSTVTGHEGKILVQAVEHLIDIPKNPQTGLPAGKRVHQGMTLTKEIDKSSKAAASPDLRRATQVGSPGVLSDLA